MFEVLTEVLQWRIIEAFENEWTKFERDSFIFFENVEVDP
jgi:hypothetical protein